MIEINKFERQWILMCKGHMDENKYPYVGEWYELLKPLFVEIYGWNPNNNYQSYLNCIFHKLLDIFLKIKEDLSGTNNQIKDIFSVIFNKNFNKEELPIERAISRLCSLIQSTTIINKDGTKRFDLSENEEIDKITKILNDTESL